MWMLLWERECELFPLAASYFLWQELIPLARNYFTVQEIISLCRKSFHLAGNNFHLSWDLISFQRNFFWQKIISICLEIISFGRTFSLTVNYFLWQETISFGRQLFPLEGNYFIWQEIVSFDRKLLPTSNFLTWHDIHDINNAWYWPDISPEIWGFPVILDARMTVKIPPWLLLTIKNKTLEVSQNIWI